VVRWADDFIVGFEQRTDAEAFLAELRERLGRFGLVLHPEKTRLIEFGRYAAERRRGRGLRKPETFNFLGFTHVVDGEGMGASRSCGGRCGNGCRQSCGKSVPNCGAAVTTLFPWLEPGWGR